MLTPTIVAAALVAGAPTSLAAMRWEKRVLLVSAAHADDPALAQQRRILQGWAAGARDRDLVLVEIVGDRVRGVGDPAAMLRRRYSLPATGFSAVLIGKDGGAKTRSRTPIDGATLQAVIDAMPMRRNGER